MLEDNRLSIVTLVKLDSAAEAQILQNLQLLVEVDASSIIHTVDLPDINLNSINSILVKAACRLFWFHKRKETPYAELDLPIRVAYKEEEENEAENDNRDDNEMAAALAEQLRAQHLTTIISKEYNRTTKFRGFSRSFETFVRLHDQAGIQPH